MCTLLCILLHVNVNAVFNGQILHVGTNPDIIYFLQQNVAHFRVNENEKWKKVSRVMWRSLCRWNGFLLRMRVTMMDCLPRMCQIWWYSVEFLSNSLIVLDPDQLVIRLFEIQTKHFFSENLEMFSRSNQFFRTK